MEAPTTWTPARPLRFVNCSDEANPQWRWLEGKIPGPTHSWTFISGFQPLHFLERVITRPHIGRIRASYQTAALARLSQADLVISHLPKVTFPTAMALRHLRANPGTTPHLAWAFNYTNLPRGMRRKAMHHYFRDVDRFVVASTAERRLYASYLDLPLERFDMVPWGPAAKPRPAEEPPLVEQPYLCAIGGEARDYGTLFDAMRKLPALHLEVVCRPRNLEGLSIPENVRVQTNIPRNEAFNIMQHARLNVIPLRDAEVPCGHVTIVWSMHLRTPVVITESAGISDYIVHEQTGLTAAPTNPSAMAEQIERMWDDDLLRERVTNAAHQFATDRCSEKGTIEYFCGYLASKGLATNASG